MLGHLKTTGKASRAIKQNNPGKVKEIVTSKPARLIC